MQASRFFVPVVLSLGMLSIAATRLVALRVEVEPLRGLDRDTVMAVTVQIAPEDRERVGPDSWVQVELKRGDRRVDRVSRAVTMDPDGAARLEIAWPPGEYSLRIDIESASGRETGFWQGRLTVPSLAQEPPPAPTATPAPLPPQPEPVAEPEPAETRAAPSPVPTEAPATEAEPPAMREESSLVAEDATSVERAEIEAEPPSVREEAPAAAEVAPSAEQTEVVPDVAGWGASSSELADLTVIVTDRNRPVLGLKSSDFAVRVNGNEIGIEAFGGASEAPLFLGLGVDVSTSMGSDLLNVSRLLRRLALNAQGGRGSTFLAVADAQTKLVHGWGATPSDLAEALAQAGSAEEGDLASLVTTSIGAFEGRLGRRLLILVSDGGDRASKDDWKRAGESVDAAGVPVLLIMLRGPGRDSRSLRQLERLAASSGGKSYGVSSNDLFEMVVEHFGDLMEASYALRFPVPDRTEPSKIRVETRGKGLEVHHPRSVR